MKKYISFDKILNDKDIKISVDTDNYNRIIVFKEKDEETKIIINDELQIENNKKGFVIESIFYALKTKTKNDKTWKVLNEDVLELTFINDNKKIKIDLNLKKHSKDIKKIEEYFLIN